MKSLAQRLAPLAAALLLLGAAPPLAAAQGRRPPRDVGGTSLLLEVKADAASAARSVERTAAVIQRRCARLGIYCRLGPPPGGNANRLLLRFSAASDPGRVKKILLAEGLELRPVFSVPHPFPMLEYPTRAEAEAVAVATADADVFPLEGYGEREAYVITARDPVITGDDLRDPVVMRAPRDTPGGGYVVDCRLRPAGARRLKAWTTGNTNAYAALVYNGRALVTLYVKAPVWYNVVVSGGFSRRQAEDAAVVLASGNLPAPVGVLEEGTYTP
ncbi:MAG TPA: hypothetical protein VF611_22275 [Pyrinomonadaceae bacterium]|jgi:preprotein translocase subunit SecD